MPDFRAFTDTFESVLGIFEKGQAVRDQLIEDATNVASAMMVCAAHTANRLNQALRASGRDAKLQLLTALGGQEIEAYSNMLGLCGQVRSAANSLRNHWLSPAAMNVNIARRAEALSVLQTLQSGENGLGEIFSELLQQPGSFQHETIEQIDAWTERTKDRVLALWQSASVLSARLAMVI